MLAVAARGLLDEGEGEDGDEAEDGAEAVHVAPVLPRVLVHRLHEGSVQAPDPPQLTRLREGRKSRWSSTSRRQWGGSRRRS